MKQISNRAKQQITELEIKFMQNIRLLIDKKDKHLQHVVPVRLQHLGTDSM